MLKSLKIFLIVLGLGIFIFPKQMIFSQNKMECSDHKTSDNKCCESSCHPEKSKTNSQKNNCGDDCNDCKSCSFHMVNNFVSPETKFKINSHFFANTLQFNYGDSYFSSAFQNIWQPPKIG